MFLVVDSLRIGRADCEPDGLNLLLKAWLIGTFPFKLLFKLLLLLAFETPDEIKLFSLTDQRFFEKSGELSATALCIRLTTLGEGSLIRDGIPLRNWGDKASVGVVGFTVLSLPLFVNKFLRTGMEDGSSLVKVFCRCRLTTGNSFGGVVFTLS